MPRLGSRVRVSFSAHKFEFVSTTDESVYCPGGGMVDALVSGASVERRAGSSPVLGTNQTSIDLMELWRDGGIGRRATLRG